MNLLSDVITYIRRIIKFPSNASITDNLLIDYINRFWIMDVDARMQLFDLKTKYQFQCTPGIDQYNMPLYNIQTEQGGQNISWYPMYQGFMAPTFINGIQCQFYNDRNTFTNLWPYYLQQLQGVAIGNGTAGPYNLTVPFFPAIPGHVDMTGIVASGSNSDPIYGTTLNLAVPTTSTYSAVYFLATGANGQNIVVADSGQFLSGVTDGNLYGLLMQPGLNGPIGNAALPNGGSLPGGPYAMTQNTICYNNGMAQNVYFPAAIPSGVPITAQCYFFEPGLPRAILYFNNTITLRSPPNTQYLIELDAYLTPAAFLNSSTALQFAYMAEYLARGAARKILSDTGDIEQFMFYEPLFKEQELLVWKRSQRQITATRTQTIYSQTGFQTNYNQSSFGGL